MELVFLLTDACDIDSDYCENGGTCEDGICECTERYKGVTCGDLKGDYYMPQTYLENVYPVCQQLCSSASEIIYWWYPVFLFDKSGTVFRQGFHYTLRDWGNNWRRHLHPTGSATSCSLCMVLQVSCCTHCVKVTPARCQGCVPKGVRESGVVSNCVECSHSLITNSGVQLYFVFIVGFVLAAI